EAQKADVLKVLEDLGVETGERTIVEVLNKIDLLEPDVAAAMLARDKARVMTGGTPADSVAVSAKDGRGLDTLIALIATLLAREEQTLLVHLQPEDGAGLAWAYAHGRVLEQRSGEKGLYVAVAADPETVERFTARYPGQVTIQQAHQGRRAISS